MHLYLKSRNWSTLFEHAPISKWHDFLYTCPRVCSQGVFQFPHTCRHRLWTQQKIISGPKKHSFVSILQGHSHFAKWACFLFFRFSGWPLHVSCNSTWNPLTYWNLKRWRSRHGNACEFLGCSLKPQLWAPTIPLAPEIQGLENRRGFKIWVSTQK